MKRLSIITSFLSVCLLAGSLSAQEPASLKQQGHVFEDLAKVKAVDPAKEYRLGDSGICGIVKEDHILVTHVQPGSPADGKVKTGDLVRGLQHYGLGDDIRATLAKRIYRLGRDWNWKLVVTVERPSLRGGKGNTVSFSLRLPPQPGLLHHFGPTGFFAKAYSDHLVVEKVAEGSPADGKLQVGDHILAIDDKPITGNIFELFTQCIDKAESKQGGGILKLNIKRPGAEGTVGETLTVELQLQVMGAYSRTTPLDCPKTDAIIARTAEKLLKAGKMGRLNIGLLGLLATGEKKYIDYVGKVLHGAAFAKPDVQLSPHSSYVNWPWSYQTIALCEYYLLTGDEYVLPAIKTYAVTIAEGQDAAGLWNHRMANPSANFGKMHARLYGYGAINQPSIKLFIALILAEKCGIKHPEVRGAIERSHRFYSNFIGKGALPYGNHGPVEHLLNNNGTSGSLAVAFSLLGNTDGARFFAMLSAAGHDEILIGHTGPFFGMLWSGLGANVAGPEVSAAHGREVRWLRTTTRTWDDRFVYMEPRGSVFSYSGCSAEGSNLLNYCVGRRAICITGKDADRSLWLRGKVAEDSARAATIDDSKQDDESLLALLGSPFPKVRLEAAQMLAVKDSDVAASVTRLLTTGSREEKIGACHAVRELRIVAAVEPLMALIRDDRENPWVREKAVDALAALGSPARAHVPELLRILVADKPYDIHGDFDRAIGSALSENLLAEPRTENLDKELFYQAANKLLDHKHHWGRTAGMSLLKNIPLEDFHRVADKILYVIKDKDRTYTAYHGDGQRQIGLDILDRLNIKEVIDLTAGTIKEPTGRVGPRVRGRVKLLKTFDANAKHAIPKIKEALGGQANEIVKSIEESTTTRKMISLEDAKQFGKKKTK